MLNVECSCCGACAAADSEVMLQLSKLMQRLSLAKRCNRIAIMWRRTTSAAAAAAAAYTPWMQLEVSQRCCNCRAGAAVRAAAFRQHDAKLMLLLTLNKQCRMLMLRRQCCCWCCSDAAAIEVAVTEATADTGETLQQVSNYVATHQILDDAVIISAEICAHIRPRPHS